MFVIFDLDGTLALTGHRSHFLAKKDWRGFFAACDEDQPNLPVIAVFHAMLCDNHRVEIWSGRSDEVADKTRRWLARYYLDVVPLRMRKAGDYTSDVALKQSWLDAADPKPDMIFDDRVSVVAMWRANGITCLQVAPGGF